MTESQRMFRSTVGGYLKENGIIVNTSDIGDDIIIEAHGKIVQLRLVEKRKILLSTIVYFNMMGEEYVESNIISEFNARHLFRGGYRLMVEPTTFSIYVEESLNIYNFDCEKLSIKLYDFVKRSISCTKWYIENLNVANENSHNYARMFV